MPLVNSSDLNAHTYKAIEELAYPSMVARSIVG
jgi:hypothetical protein